MRKTFGPSVNPPQAAAAWSSAAQFNAIANQARSSAIFDRARPITQAAPNSDAPSRLLRCLPGRPKHGPALLFAPHGPRGGASASAQLANLTTVLFAGLTGHTSSSLVQRDESAVSPSAAKATLPRSLARRSQCAMCIVSNSSNAPAVFRHWRCRDRLVRVVRRVHAEGLRVVGLSQHAFLLVGDAAPASMELHASHRAAALPLFRLARPKRLSVGTCLPMTTWKANTREMGQFLKYIETRAVAALVYRSSRIVLSRSYTETSIAADSAVLNKPHLDEICYGLLRTSQSGVF
jgi:hypothetical protein